MRRSLLVLLLPACTPMPELHFNEPPGAPTLHIDPALPTTEDPLVTVIDADATDPEGDALGYQVDWYLDGELRVEGARVLDPSYTTRNETWQAVIRANDGEWWGDEAQDSVTIVNALPTLSSYSLDPVAPTTEDDLVVSAGGTDPDGDTVIFLVAWSRDGVVEPTYANIQTLPAAATASGEEWTATVTPSDGFDTGEPESLSVYIDNTVPALDTMRVLPTAPTVDDAVGVTVTVDDPDEPDQTVSVEFTWFVDGVEVATETETDGNSYLADAFVKGQEVSVTAIPWDGFAYGDAQTSDPVTVVNTPPVLDAVSLTPAVGYEASTFECLVGTATDADGDDVGFDYAWYVNGAAISASDDTLDGSDFASGDEIYCVVTPDDGDDDGAAVTSDTSVVENTLPTLTAVTITPTSPTVATQLTANVTGGTDADGDSITYTYAWRVNGTVVASTNSNLPTTNYVRGDEVEVTVTPRDATGSGTAVTSSAVTIDNALPTVSNVNISPGTAYTDDDLSVTVSGWSDADGDDESYTYQWYRNSSAISGQTGTSLDESYTTRGDRIYCAVTPYDGYESGTPRSSPTLTIANSPPDTVADVSSGLTANECDSIDLDATGSDDVDGDALTYTWSLTTKPTGSLAATSDIDGTTDAEPTFVVDYAGTFTFSLSASDSYTSASDTVSVTVYDAADNVAPVSVPAADATEVEQTTGCSSSGSGYVCTPCSGTFAIDAISAYDDDDDPLHFTWSTSSGYATIASSTAEATTVSMRNMPTTHLTSTSYQATITLRVQDCAGNTDTEDLVLTYVCTGN